MTPGLRWSLVAVSLMAVAGAVLTMSGGIADGRRPRQRPPVPVPVHDPLDGPMVGAPRLALEPVVGDALCTTHGEVERKGASFRITEPTVRAVALGSNGDAARLRFRLDGNSATERRLASSQLRRQVGVKLRAENGCNLVYVMWRIEPKPGLEVSVKRNPGARDNSECGTRGYTKIKAQRSTPTPAPAVGSTHTLQAELRGEDLFVWIDDAMVWRGPLGPTARGLRGPAGVRTDNVAVEVEDFSAPRDPAMAVPRACEKGGRDDG